ncbi:hypothetical protein ATKI12_4293 [Kitasatospora sp. Ki12]|uniref:hypothetical protein n=1 Tax=Kitasatospora xanthocidica TaxID=83382 RepID=UPI001679A312|nr:hypothetical protein [Kitasatospora xanthocidica]GHF39053.1 hypothetical protein GCM10018790_16080 [Kitasatospora xanthocidica]
MADDQPTETTADEPEAAETTARPTTVKATQPVGRQRLETKTIQGQIITHTIVKPLPE